MDSRDSGESTSLTHVSKKFGLPLFDLNAWDINSFPKITLKSEIVKKLHAFPLFQHGNHLFVAITDATRLKALDEIRNHSGLNTVAVLVEKHKFAVLFDKILSLIERISCGLESISLKNLSLNEESDHYTSEYSTEDVPILRFIHHLLFEAINAKVSDIHFEPFENQYRIRFRQDGHLYEHSSQSVALGSRLAACIKVLSRLDIAEKRLPQDGHYKMKGAKSQNTPSREIDFRVSTCPTRFGEKIVMRLLDQHPSQLEINALGMEDFQKTIFLEALHKPQGLILVTGPTGSGKTVTLYTGLNILNDTKRNISSCEDPVEIDLPGINQVCVNLKAGMDFATALRTFLRQDPDVIMVGEIRDLETADMAVKAAHTGHLVLSTLHTNSAAETLTRLSNMGIPSFNLATSVSLVISQRLIRKLCQRCKSIEINCLPEPALLQIGFRKNEISDLVIYTANGCEYCKDGFKGREAIYEMMPVSENLQDMILAGGNARALYQEAMREGMWDLKQSALHKVKHGITCLQEMTRVVG